LNCLSRLSQITTKIKVMWHRRKEPYIISAKFGILYLVMPNSALDFHIVENGILNDWAATQMYKLIPQNGIIFDIGANVGLLTLPFARIYVPKGVVYAYEPVFQYVCQLQINTEINQLNNVVVLPIALQNDLNIDQSSLYVRRAVEGAEFKVLQGGEHTHNKHLPIVQYECSTIIDDLTNCPNGINCFNFMRDLVYKQYEIVNEKYLTEFSDPKRHMPGSNIICFHNSKIPEKIL